MFNSENVEAIVNGINLFYIVFTLADRNLMVHTEPFQEYIVQSLRVQYEK